MNELLDEPSIQSAIREAEQILQVTEREAEQLDFRLETVNEAIEREYQVRDFLIATKWILYFGSILWMAFSWSHLWQEWLCLIMVVTCHSCSNQAEKSDSYIQKAIEYKQLITKKLDSYVTSGDI